LDKTSFLLNISSLHIIVSVVNGESFLLSSVDCLVKGGDPKSFKVTVLLCGIKRERNNEAVYEERNLPIQIHGFF